MKDIFKVFGIPFLITFLGIPILLYIVHNDQEYNQVNVIKYKFTRTQHPRYDTLICDKDTFMNVKRHKYTPYGK